MREAVQLCDTNPPQPCLVRPPPQPMFETAILSAAEAARFSDTWVDLAQRCLEPNVFFEAEFALPALAHLGARGRLHVVFVWRDHDDARRLVGILPIVVPRVSFGACCRAWVHEQAVLGMPLIDGDGADETLDAMLSAIGKANPRLAVLLLPLIPQAGPTFALLQKYVARRGRELRLFDAHERAVLRSPFTDPLSPGAAAELRRLRRRLADGGSLTYRRRQDPAEIAEAMEEFLTLEAQGWKGRRRSALAGTAGTAAFARELARRMGEAGKIAVDSFELAGRAIAMGVLLKSADRAFFWKIAYDEAHATRSPGVLFTQDLTRRQIADTRIVMTDSCARPDHPMINRLWPGRLALADVAIPLVDEQSSIGLALRIETFRRALRGALKNVRNRLLAYVRK